MNFTKLKSRFPFISPILLLTFPFNQQLLIPAKAALRNITVDDTFPNSDSASTARVSFFPSNGWTLGQNCQGCLVQPDRGQASNGSWHDTTYDTGRDTVPPYLSIDFIGSAIYLYCIIANQISDQVGTTADYIFVLDGANLSSVPGGRYTHPKEATSAYYYNVPVYSNTSLENATHNVELHPVGGNGSQSTLVLFDYFVYTADDGTSSGKHTNKGAIAGGTVGGVAAVILIGFVIWYFLRRRLLHHHLQKEQAQQSDFSYASNIQPFSIASRPGTASVSQGHTDTPSSSSYPVNVHPFGNQSRSGSSPVSQGRTQAPSSAEGIYSRPSSGIQGFGANQNNFSGPVRSEKRRDPPPYSV